MVEGDHETLARCHGERVSEPSDGPRRQGSLAWLPVVLLVCFVTFIGLSYLLDALSWPRWGEALVQAAVVGTVAYVASKVGRKVRR